MKTLFTLLFSIASLTLFAADAKPYPLKTCVVSGEALDSMGKPYVFVHDGQEIKMCCKNCLKDFNKEPDKYLKQISTEKVK